MGGWLNRVQKVYLFADSVDLLFSRWNIPTLKLLTIVLLLLSPCSFASTTDDCFAAIYSLNEGRLDEAIKLYSQCIESGSLSKKNLIVAHNDRGNAYGRKGDYRAAITDFNQTIFLSPDNASAYFNRGLAYYSQGLYGLAIEDLQQRLKLYEAGKQYADKVSNKFLI